MSCFQGCEFVSGNIFIRPVKLAKAGDVLAGHQHHFNHTTIVISGLVKVVASDGKAKQWEKEFGRGLNNRHFLVKSNWTHEVTALTDDVEFLCVFSHRDKHGEVVEKYDGNDRAYAAVVT